MADFPGERELFRQRPGWRRYLGPKRVMVLLLFGSGLLVLWYLRSRGYLTPALVFRLIHEHPVSAPAIFIACYALFLIFMMPTLPLNLGAGVLWGPLAGSFFSAAGVWLGAAAAFLIARTALGQPLARRCDNRMITWLQRELETKGWKVVAFTRVTPIFPCGALNFAYGLTSIPFTTYAWATMVFVCPPVLTFAIIGHSSGELLLHGRVGGLTHLIMVVSGALLALLAAIMITRRWFYGRGHAVKSKE